MNNKYQQVIEVSHNDISAQQCRAARAGLRMKREDLSKASGVAFPTITNFEAGRSSPQARTLRDLRAALEQAGATFTETGGVEFAKDDSD